LHLFGDFQICVVQTRLEVSRSLAHGVLSCRFWRVQKTHTHTHTPEMEKAWRQFLHTRKKKNKLKKNKNNNNNKIWCLVNNGFAKWFGGNSQ